MIEPVAVMVRRFRCPFCSRTHSAARAAREHMGRCWLNPATRSCKTCANWDVEPGGEPCFPGRPCDCNHGYVQCLAGVAGVDRGEIKTGCPLWRAREGNGDD